MKTTIVNLISFIALGSVIAFSGACKKQDEPTAQDVVKNKGCSDIDSPLYDPEVEEDDNSCTYARVSKYEITYHPEKTPSGSVWDYGLGSSTNADLILRVKEQGASSWSFESSIAENQEHNSPAEWSAPSPLKLLNKTYEWELYDQETTNADDFISSGTFNPISLANEGTITTTSGGSQLKIYYNLQ